MNFEINKWYKSNAGGGTCSTGFYYLKVLELKGETPYGQGLARNNYMENHWWSAHETLKQALELGPMLDLTEIEPYLPEGHPDKKFVLPETWYIQLTEENREDVIKWHKTKDEWSRAYTLESYYGLKNGNRDAWKIGCLPENSNLITYNQFKKYVLNQQEENFSYLDKLLEKWNIK